MGVLWWIYFVICAHLVMFHCFLIIQLVGVTKIQTLKTGKYELRVKYRINDHSIWLSMWSLRVRRVWEHEHAVTHQRVSVQFSTNVALWLLDVMSAPFPPWTRTESQYAASKTPECTTVTTKFVQYYDIFLYSNADSSAFEYLHCVINHRRNLWLEFSLNLRVLWFQPGRDSSL